MQLQPKRGWSHHTTYDLIIEVKGDAASIDVQFVRFDSLGDKRPKAGWPANTAGVTGVVSAAEYGYYRPTLKNINEEWKIEKLQIIHELPFAIPGQ
ncbi:MAG TPA: hypothetical protein VF609_17060 [Flavisolibacter sp.]